MKTENQPIADLDDARRIVAKADAARMALPAARAHHAVLMARWSAANAAAEQAMDHLRPMLSTMAGIDPQADAERADAWKAKERAMVAMWKVGGAAIAAEADVARLAGLADGDEAAEARRIVAAADDLVVLRQVAGLGDSHATPKRRRIM